MGPTKTSHKDEIRTKLLEEGMQSYLGASTALVAFEREVQKICRGVFERHVEEYSDAIQMVPRLEASEIKDGIWPKAEEFDGEWKSVGVTIERRGVPPNIGWWGTYCYLTWGVSHDQIHGWVGEWIAPRSVAERVYQRFHAIKSEVVIDGKEVGLWHTFGASEGGNFEKGLDRHMADWIELWRNVSGINGIFKE